MLEIITQSIKIMRLQNINPVNACNNILAVEASTQIHNKAFGFLINDDSVTRNHASMSIKTIPHHIATFFREKLVTDHFFISVGLFTCT